MPKPLRATAQDAPVTPPPCHAARRPAQGQVHTTVVTLFNSSKVLRLVRMSGNRGPAARRLALKPRPLRLQAVGTRGRPGAPSPPPWFPHPPRSAGLAPLLSPDPRSSSSLCPAPGPWPRLTPLGARRRARTALPASGRPLVLSDHLYVNT